MVKKIGGAASAGFYCLYQFHPSLAGSPSKIHGKCSRQWIEPDEIWHNDSGAKSQTTVHQVTAEKSAEAFP